jgi:hypothetical protein
MRIKPEVKNSTVNENTEDGFSPLMHKVAIAVAFIAVFFFFFKLLFF